MYLECRFSNTITTPNCDCVQILADAKPGADSIPATGHANHKHLPEEFEMITANLHHTSIQLNALRPATNSGPLTAGIAADVFRPPVA